MDKRDYLFIALICAASGATAVAEAPAGYYDTAVGKSGNSLQLALSDLIGNHELGYDNLWTAYKTTDKRADGKVWDMYSSTSNFTFGSDQCGNYSGEGDCYNREHSVPKSWLGGRKYSDAHVVVPTDGYVNNRRSSLPFGEVASADYVSDGGFSRMGSCAVSGYSGDVFEPADEYKGDFARIYFYMATRYTTSCGSWSGAGASVFSGTFPYLKQWTRQMMLQWHRDDPVSQKEIDRNEAVYALQGNRNPFIDYPELVDLIFGDQTTTPFSPGETVYIEAPTSGSTCAVGSVLMGSSQLTATATITVQGHNFTQDVTLAVTGAHAGYFAVTPATLTAAAVNAGTTVQVSYTPTVSGSHTATLQLSSSELSTAVTVNLTGTAYEDFCALPAGEITHNSFVANWMSHSQATSYELSVWKVTAGTSQEQQLVDVDFATNPGWATDGYTATENGALRLGSSSNPGSVTTPELDLSTAPIGITVTCSPYRTSDNSHLYVLVDGAEVASIDCSLNEVTETVTIDAPATQASTITFKANAKARVYLQHVTITVGGGQSTELLGGYPVNVGNVLQYTVTGLDPQTEYCYSVVALNGSSELETSNVVNVNTAVSGVEKVTDLPDGLYVYAYAGNIYIDGAPANTRAYYYTVDGRLCGMRTLHATRETLNPARKGIYLVRVVTDRGSYTTRVMVH